MATNIAETSLTIEGVTVVIDSGLSRRPVYEASTGITRLETVAAAQSAITQRAGRAGRTTPGKAIRLWHAGQTAARPAFPPPEIEQADLTRLVLDLADWGVVEPQSLAWLDPPPAAHWREAVSLLSGLGAMDEGGITAQGRKLHHLPLHPRLAHMLVFAAGHGRPNLKRAVQLAVLLEATQLASCGFAWVNFLWMG